MLPITLMSPQGEQYLKHGRLKSRKGASSLPCLPSRTLFLKDQYFNMQDHPVLCKEETTEGDRIRSSRARMAGKPEVVPMQRCLECRTRSLVQDPSFAGCRTIVAKINGETKCTTQPPPRSQILRVTESSFPSLPRAASATRVLAQGRDLAPSVPSVLLSMPVSAVWYGVQNSFRKINASTCNIILYCCARRRQRERIASAQAG